MSGKSWSVMKTIIETKPYDTLRIDVYPTEEDDYHKGSPDCQCKPEVRDKRSGKRPLVTLIHNRLFTGDEEVPT